MCLCLYHLLNKKNFSWNSPAFYDKQQAALSNTSDRPKQFSTVLPEQEQVDQSSVSRTETEQNRTWKKHIKT